MRSELIRSKLTEISESINLVQEHLPSEFDSFIQLGLVKDGIL
jgi:hypothetical protein